MTINELRNAVKVELDKTSSLDLPAFEPEEIDYWLTLAIKRIVEDRYNKYMAGDSSIKLQEELGNLYIHLGSFPTTNTVITGQGVGKMYVSTLTHTGSPTVDHPLYSDFITDLYIESVNKVLTDGSTIVSYWQKGKLISEKESSNYLSSGNNYRYFEEPVYYRNVASVSAYPTLTDPSFIIITDYFTASIGAAVRISYISKPIEINSTNFPSGSDEYYSLPKHVHHNVVNMAVMLMLENIESQRLQTNVAVINKEE